MQTTNISMPLANARRPEGTLANFARFGQRFLQTRLTMPAMIFLAIVLFCAIFAPIVAPFDPITDQNYSEANQGPSAKHWFGTDYLGRDTLSRVIFGARISLLVGFVSVTIGLLFGVTIGLITGYFGKLVDAVLMRFMDALMAFPSLMLALAITSALGPGAGTAMIAIGIVNIPTFARLARASTLAAREMDYISASNSIGTSSLRILFQHILPNISAPLIVQGSLGFATAIITEAGLSFLGVGTQLPTPSWGIELRSGFQYMELNPSLAFFPGMAIFFTVLSLNFLGDSLRAALDPKLRQRGQG